MQKPAAFIIAGFFVISMTILVPTYVFAGDHTDGIWINTGTSTSAWDEATNWKDRIIPGTVGTTDNNAMAIFNAQVGEFGTEGNPILIDSLKNFGGFTFDTNAGNYYFHVDPLTNILLSSGNSTQITGAFKGDNLTETIDSNIELEGSGGGTYAFTNNSGSLGNGILAFKGNIWGVASAGNTTVLTLNGSNTDANTISGIISDGTGDGKLSITKSGSGTWILSGANTFTGDVNINAGTLVAANASALGINGIINNGATLTIGTTHLTVGAYEQFEGSTLNLTANSSSDYGKITTALINTAFNANSTINVTVGGYIPNNAVLTIATRVTGMPDYVNSSSHFVTFTDAILGGNLILTAIRSTTYLSSIATNSNAANVGHVLDNITNPSSDMITVLTALDNSSSSQAAASLNTFTPQLDNSTPQVSHQSLGNYLYTITDHLGNLIFAHDSNSTTGISTGDPARNNGIWAQGFGSYLHQNPQGLSKGYNAVIWGTALGYDRLLTDNLRLGASFGYANDDVDSKDNGAATGADSYQGTLYANYLCKNNSYLDGVFAFAYNTYTGSRHISFGGIDRIANFSYNGQQYSSYLEWGKHFSSNKFSLTPLLSLQYEYLALGSYTETNAGALDLHVGSQDYNFLESGLGAKINYAADTKLGTFIPELHAKWLYDFVNDNQQTTSAFTGGGASFATQGFKPARNSANIGSRLTLMTKNNIELSLNYDFQIKKDFQGHYGYLNVRYSF